MDVVVVVAVVMVLPHLHFTFFENNIFLAFGFKSGVGLVSVRPKK